MNHTTVYMGRLSLNFDGLNSKTTHYEKPDGTKAAHYGHANAVDGLEFGFMEKLRVGQFAVKVGPVILDVPVKINTARHLDGKTYGPGQNYFGDKSAQRLVADAILLNPQKAEAILDHVWTKISSQKPSHAIRTGA